MKTMTSPYIFSIVLCANFSLYTMENAAIQCFTIAPTTPSNTYLKKSSDQLPKHKKKQKYQSLDLLDLLKERAIEIQSLNEICVPMWDYASIVSTLNISKTISINGLGGCLAAAIHIRYNNGEQYVGVTNYPRVSYQHQQNNLKILCEEASNAQHTTKKIIATNFIFMEPDKNMQPQSPIIQHYSLEYEGLKNIIEKILTKTIITSYCYLYTMGHKNRHEIGDQTWRNLEIILYRNKATIIVQTKKSIVTEI